MNAVLLQTRAESLSLSVACRGDWAVHPSRQAFHTRQSAPGVFDLDALLAS